MACHTPNFPGLEQKYMFTLILLFLVMYIPLHVESFIHPSCYWKMKQKEEKNTEKETCAYVLYALKMPVKTEDLRVRLSDLNTPGNLQFTLALVFALDEVNRKPGLLPNVSLLFDYVPVSCNLEPQINNEAKTHILVHKTINYMCGGIDRCYVILSGPNWEKSLIIGKDLDNEGLHQIVQLTFGPFHSSLNDHEQFPYLYQMAPKDISLALAMVSLILHFRWNWVGLAISDNDDGIQFLSYLRREMEQHIVCFAFVNMIPVDRDLYMSRFERYYDKIMKSGSNVVIIYGDTDSTLALIFQKWKSLGIKKIWVTTSQWDVTTSKSNFIVNSPHSTLSFAHHHDEISGFQTFVQSLGFITPTEYLARLEWMNFNCEALASTCKTMKNCSSNASLEWLISQTSDMAFSDASYNIYDAVYMVAHFFHEMLLQPFSYGKAFEYNCSKVFSYLRKIQVSNSAGETVNINHKEKLQAEYDIFQIWNFPNGFGLKVKIGKFSPYLPHEQQLHLYEDLIDWATGRGEMPTSVCSADCGPGFRKFRQEGMAVCCFDCGPCPENEVSNETNVDQCVKCPETQYANFEQNHCIHKEVIYLSYEDPLGMALTLMVLCFTLFTFAVFGVFVKYNDTPIVKANNRSLSYTLLVSLTFCFLCPLLFIGRPNTTTCILQQITFGVVFTVAVSTVLAKTITVLLAFKITTPGRIIRYYLISRAPNYIIVICVFIQIIICAVWLGVSPPSVDTDTHSEHGHIIILCDKGSVTAFYCVLGYHGSLALVTFIVSFLVRNLPDTFNEAKLLTFSMLLFCSVWVTFLPVYHSTKGKVMVAVEVFSILASSAGLLGCIFFPKCYIILLRPERNSLPKLKEKSSVCPNIS